MIFLEPVLWGSHDFCKNLRNDCYNYIGKVVVVSACVSSTTLTLQTEYIQLFKHHV